MYELTNIIYNYEFIIYALSFLASSLIVINIVKFLFTTPETVKYIDEDEEAKKERDWVEFLIHEGYVTFQELTSIIMPKKGDFVKIIGGKRWIGAIGKITSTDTDNTFNIKMYKKYNPDFGNDIPKFNLKNRHRDYFSVLTDGEIFEEELFDNENI
ncbi:hypothetical protein CPAV1605_897 [seawater metagenome]|uniref:Uncharacterized protein n=1 Tax=seawater metagenome TaxID=1561972 RepID=A0A5E8CLZ7_9ZZZZ